MRTNINKTKKSRNRNSFAITVLLIGIAIFSSCSEEDVLYEELTKGTGVPEQDTLILKSEESLIDSIIQLNEEDFPKKEVKIRSLGVSMSTLYELNGIEFYIQGVNNNYGKNTLETTGKGRELKLSSLNWGNSAQLFRLRFLPSSSGIPYLIYSHKENVPIGVGSYPNSPETYVLYAKKSDSGGLFGFSWKFCHHSDNNSLIIENQDIIGSSGGGYWGIYYHAMTNLTSGKIGILKNNRAYNQQYEIIPNDVFDIKSIRLLHNQGRILETKPVILDESHNTNYSYTHSSTFNYNYNKSITNSASFQEQESISTKKSGKVNAGVSIANVVNLGSSYSIEKGSTQTVTYGNQSSVTNSISKSYTVPIPPRTEVVVYFRAFRHKLSIPYEATLEGQKTGQRITIRGVWEGVDYTYSTLKIHEYSVDTRKAMGIFYLESNK